MVSKRFQLVFGWPLPEWFGKELFETKRIRPLPGYGINMWGKDGAEVDTPSGPIRARPGDYVLRAEDGTLSVERFGD